MRGYRKTRVGDRIRQELSRLIRTELRDPRVGFVTLTDVALSPDLRDARVYVSALGDDLEEALKALNGASPFLKRLLARTAGLRFTPELRFVADHSLETGSRIEQLLDDMHHDEDDDDPETGAS